VVLDHKEAVLKVQRAVDRNGGGGCAAAMETVGTFLAAAHAAGPRTVEDAPMMADHSA
jgi:hypothetical protein